MVQRVVYDSEAALWAALDPTTPLAHIRTIINGNAELQTAYDDVLLNLNRMDFIQQAGTQPNAASGQNAGHNYNINYGPRATLNDKFRQRVHFIAAMIHEMAHVSSALDYVTNMPEGSAMHIANMHLPAAAGPLFDGTTVGENQRNDPLHGWEAQRQTMEANWAVLSNLRTGQHGFNTDELDILDTREQYATGIAPETHYDTVLMDILFVLQREGLTETHYYLQATAMLHEANARRRAGAGDVQAVPAVAAPVNRFAQLHAAVTVLLNDALWSDEGSTLPGSKVPDGILRMRTELANPNPREALDAIADIAINKNASYDFFRSRSTTDAYRALARLKGRNNFLGVIAQVQACQQNLGT